MVPHAENVVCQLGQDIKLGLGIIQPKMLRGDLHSKLVNVVVVAEPSSKGVNQPRRTSTR